MTKPTEVVEAFYAALARSDVPAVLALLHDDVEWTEAEGFPYYSGTWHSPGEVLENLLKPLARDWDGFSVTSHDTITQGDRVVSLGTYAGTFKANGKKMQADFAHVWTVRIGRIASFVMYADTAKVREAIA